MGILERNRTLVLMGRITHRIMTELAIINKAAEFRKKRIQLPIVLARDSS